MCTYAADIRLELTALLVDEVLSREHIRSISVALARTGSENWSRKRPKLNSRLIARFLRDRLIVSSNSSSHSPIFALLELKCFSILVGSKSFPVNHSHLSFSFFSLTVGIPSVKVAIISWVIMILYTDGLIPLVVCNCLRSSNYSMSAYYLVISRCTCSSQSWRILDCFWVRKVAWHNFLSYDTIKFIGQPIQFILLAQALKYETWFGRTWGFNCNVMRIQCDSFEQTLSFCPISSIRVEMNPIVTSFLYSYSSSRLQLKEISLIVKARSRLLRTFRIGRVLLCYECIFLISCCCGWFQWCTSFLETWLASVTSL